MSPVAAQMRGDSPWGRLKTAVRYAISGVSPDTWMSPMQPVDPVAQEAFGRNRDYPVGYNLTYTPRSTERTSFQQLRDLADNCDLVRLAIETRKDQMASLKWTIGHVDPNKDSENDARVQKLLDLFKYPDRVLDWDAWLRMILEDVLVIDAPAVLPRRLNSGDMYGFEIIDGATIKPLVDDSGRRPMPPSPAYQQNLKGLPAVDYTAAELIYRPRNPRSHKFYGYSPVEQILLTINIAIRRSVSQLQYYTEGNIPAAFVMLPAGWSPQQIEQFQAYWDTVIEGDQAFKRKARFVPEGSKPAQLMEPPLKDEFDEWIARVVCYCFSLPPTAFVKQMNRSTSETQQATAVSEGLGPLMNWTKGLLDYLVQVQLGYADLEFKWVEEESIDPAVQAEVLTTYQKCGNLNINDVRAKLGEDPIEGGDTYLIYTASGAVTLDSILNPPEPPPSPVVDENGKPIAPTDPRHPAQRALAANGQGNDAQAKDDQPKPDGDAEKVEKGHLHKSATEPLTADEKRLKEAFVQALDQVREDALKKLSSMAKAANNTDDRDVARWDEPQTWAETYASTIDTSGLSLAWDDYTDTLEAVSADGARQSVARIIVEDPTAEPAARGAGFDLLNHQDPNAIDWAGRHAAEMLSSDGKTGDLVEATRNMVRQTVASALEDHATNDDLVKALTDAYAFSEQRAELIARTEVHNALGNGALEGAKAVGMQSKSWLLSNDEGICPQCQANADQKWIPINKPFVSGAMAPGQHPNCRCDAVYRRQPAED